jgi:hypothetical protein
MKTERLSYIRRAAIGAAAVAAGLASNGCIDEMFFGNSTTSNNIGQNVANAGVSAGKVNILDNTARSYSDYARIRNQDLEYSQDKSLSLLERCAFRKNLDQYINKADQEHPEWKQQYERK